ncbi:MAG: hypothetical protein ACXVZP_10755 [Gaiellaceae bacterium]
MALAGATGLVLLVGVSAAAPPTETRYAGQLRQAAAQVEASLSEVSALNKEDAAALATAGQHLTAAAGSACQALRAYQHATTRFGTDEEYQLVQRLGQQLLSARSAFGAAAGVGLAGPTARQQSSAEQLLRTVAASAASEQIAEWIGDERLADVLTGGNIREIRSGLQRELTHRINAEARSLSQRAVGLSLSLDAPLRGQVESQAEQAALRWLAKTVLRWDATGLAIQLVGVPIVRFLRTELKEAFRDHKHVTERVNRTTAGFESRIGELEKLIASAESASLDRARRLLSRAQRAIDATVYLRSDLKKQGRNDLISRLAAAEARLKAKMGETRQAFLLDSRLASSNVARMADDVCKLQGEIVKITKKLGSGSKPPTGGDPAIGDWDASRGVVRITQTAAGTFEGRLIKKGCEATAKLGQVEVRLSKTSARNQYTATIRYLAQTTANGKLSCRFLAEVQAYQTTYWPAQGSSPESLGICARSPVAAGTSSCENWVRHGR